MKKFKYLFAITLAVAALGFAVPAMAVSVEFGPLATFQAGDPVTVDVLVTGLGTAPADIVSAYDLQITYDTAFLSAVGVRFGPYLGFPFSLQSASPSDVAEVSFLSDADLLALQGPAISASGGKLYLFTLDYFALQDGDTSSLAFVWGPSDDVKGSGNIQIYPPTTVPEPGTMLLLGTGLAGLFGAARRKARK